MPPDFQCPLVPGGVLMVNKVTNPLVIQCLTVRIVLVVGSIRELLPAGVEVDVRLVLLGVLLLELSTLLLT